MPHLREIDQWLMRSVLPHRRDLNMFARRLVGPDEAEDVVQEALLRMVALPNWRDIDNPRAFAITVVRNLALERGRRAARFTPVAAEAVEGFEIADDAPGPFVVIDSRRNHQRLLSLLQDLPPQCRRAVELRKFDGKSPGEIAEIMEISVSTVEKHLVKGIARLVSALRAEGVGTDGDDLKAPWQQPNQRTK